MPDSLATAGPKYLRLLRHPSVLSALAIGLAVAEVLLDVSTWIELNIAIIYSLPLVLAAAARNRRLLWGLALSLVCVTFVVYWQQSQPAVPVLHDQYFMDRVLAAVSVLLAAVLLHALSVAAEALDARNKQLSAYQQEITQRNRELDLQRAEAKEASDRKTRLLMSVSHDIRSPLTTINLMADLIKSTTSDPVHLAKLPGLAQNLQTNALSLAELVTDVLDIAYFDSGRIELRETDFSLNDVIAEECRSLEPLAAAKGLTLAPELTGPAIWLRADRIKLARVLRNLINNAIQFTARGGVTVARALTSERGVEIRVIDTGIGITPEDLQRIFGEFTQLGYRGSGERAGWGLGLAICRRLARLMGGEVSAESGSGSGSVFIVHLPSSRVLPRS
jgi:signal transduction histidine kinase